MTVLDDFRAKYPQYKDVPDGKLASAIRKKYYADMPATEFYRKTGLTHLVGISETPQTGPESDPSVTGQAKEFAMGAAHHLANLPLGLAQLFGHGVTAAADLLPEDSRIRQAVDATGQNFDANAKHREAEYQHVVPDSPGSYVGAAAGELAPWLLGLGELRAAGAIPAATTTAGKLGTLALEGGAMGLAQPVTGEGSYGRQKTVQTAVGAATGPALHGLGMAAGGLRNVAQHITSPQVVADANIARMFGDAPDVVAKLRQAPAYVPGESPTAAQVLATPEAVQAERTLRNNPASGPAFVAQDNANNAARQNVVGRLAGTPDDMKAAIDTRRANAQPFIESSLTPSQPAERWSGAADAFQSVLDKAPRMPSADFDAIKAARKVAAQVKSGAMQEDDAAAELADLGASVTTKAARDAFAKADTSIDHNMVDPSGVLKTIATIRNGPLGVNPKVAEGLDFLTQRITGGLNTRGKVGTDILDAVRQQASRLLGNAKVPGSAVGTQQGIALGPVKNQIVEAIDRVAPGYRDYVAGYRADSTPINTMQSVGKLADPNAPGSLNAAGDPQLAISRLRQVLRGDDKAKFPMSMAARGELDKVLKSLSRRTISDNKIAASGPGTAADLQTQGGLASLVFGPNMGAKGGALTRLLGGVAGAGLGSHFGPLGAAAGSGLGGLIGDALGAANRRVISRAGESAADAKKAADAIERYLRTKRGQGKLAKLVFGLEAPVAAKSLMVTQP
jgi:hypothetical protein